MTRKIINIGTGPDSHTGDPLRTAWGKTNDNFAELYSLTANLANVTATANTGNITFTAQTISGQLANTDITIDPPGSGKVSIVGNLTTSNLRFLGSTISTQYSGDLTLDASAGNIKLNDPLKFSDGTVQYSAAVGNAGTVNTLTITNATATTLNSTTGVFTGNVTAGNVQATSFRFANGNSILANISTVGFTGNYSSLSGTPTIPTNTSQLVNDTGFITAGGLSSYATITYVDNAVANLVANAPATLDTLREITDSLGNLTSIVDYVDNSVANAVPNLSSYSGNIIPSANVTYSLGNATNRWANLWLSGNTIQLGNLSLSASANGLTSTSGFDLANSTAANIEATGNITASDMSADRIYANVGVETPQVQFTDTVSGNGINLLNNGGFLVYESNLGSAGGFVPSADDSESIGQSDRRWATVYANAFIGDGSQLSNVASTGNLEITGTLIEIAAGAPETSIVISPSGPTGGQAFVDVPDNTTANTANLRIYNSLGNIELGTNSGNSSWYFGSDGNLIIPGEIQGIEGTAGGVANIRGGFGTAGPGGDVYIVGGASGNGSSEFGNVIVGAGVGAWTFDNTGVLTVPGTVQPVTGNDLDIKGSSDNLGVYIFAQGTDGLANGAAEIDITANGVTVYSAYGENSPGSPNVKWVFDQTGNITLPSNVANINYSNGTSILSGISSTSSYGNSNVVTLLSSFGSNAVSTTGNITGGNISTAGNITGNTAGYTIGYRDIPQVSLTGNVTLAATDGGKHYYSANAIAILTIPNNTSTSFSIGTAVTVIQQGSASITITPDTGVTLYMAGNSTSSSRTLSNYGMATIMKVATDTWFINGTGVS